MLVEDIVYLQKLNINTKFDSMHKKEAVTGTSCPRELARLYTKRFYFKLLSIDAPLYHIPTCSKFQRIDWRKYEEEYGFTIQSKLIKEE